MAGAFCYGISFYYKVESSYTHETRYLIWE